MIDDIVLGSILTLTTTAIHGLVTAGLFSFLRVMRADRWALRTTRSRVAVISALVLALFLVSVFEAAVWAAVYVTVGAIEGFEQAFYFSVVTFTTLGYGDITVGQEWRLMAALQAANGILIFGWSTALIVTALQRLIARAQNR